MHFLKCSWINIKKAIYPKVIASRTKFFYFQKSFCLRILSLGGKKHGNKLWLISLRSYTCAAIWAKFVCNSHKFQTFPPECVSNAGYPRNHRKDILVKTQPSFSFPTISRYPFSLTSHTFHNPHRGGNWFLLQQQHREKKGRYKCPNGVWDAYYAGSGPRATFCHVWLAG